MLDNEFYIDIDNVVFGVDDNNSFTIKYFTEDSWVSSNVIKTKIANYIPSILATQYELVSLLEGKEAIPGFKTFGINKICLNYVPWLQDIYFNKMIGERCDYFSTIDSISVFNSLKLKLLQCRKDVEKITIKYNGDRFLQRSYVVIHLKEHNSFNIRFNKLAMVFDDSPSSEETIRAIADIKNVIDNELLVVNEFNITTK